MAVHVALVTVSNICGVFVACSRVVGFAVHLHAGDEDSMIALRVRTVI
jgi:hypothetical protein